MHFHLKNSPTYSGTGFIQSLVISAPARWVVVPVLPGTCEAHQRLPQVVEAGGCPSYAWSTMVYPDVW